MLTADEREVILTSRGCLLHSAINRCTHHAHVSLERREAHITLNFHLKARFAYLGLRQSHCLCT